MVDSLRVFIDALIAKKEKHNIDVSLIKDKYQEIIFNILAKCFGIFNVHQLFDKDESEANFK